MTLDELHPILDAVRAGRELSFRSPEGWWGLRAGAGGALVLWERYPYEASDGERIITDAEVAAMIGSWAVERVQAALAPAAPWGSDTSGLPGV